MKKKIRNAQDSDGLPGEADTARATGPPVHEEPWTKVTVALFDRQTDYLDRLALDIRQQTASPAGPRRIDSGRAPHSKPPRCISATTARR